MCCLVLEQVQARGCCAQNIAQIQAVKSKIAACSTTVYAKRKKVRDQLLQGLLSISRQTLYVRGDTKLPNVDTLSTVHYPQRRLLGPDVVQACTLLACTDDLDKSKKIKRRMYSTQSINLHFLFLGLNKQYLAIQHTLSTTCSMRSTKSTKEMAGVML